MIDIKFVLIAVAGLALLAWMCWRLDRSYRREKDVLEYARAHPEEVEQAVLFDGDPTTLTIKLTGKNPVTCLALGSAVDCVRVFDELKASSASGRFIIQRVVA